MSAELPQERLLDRFGRHDLPAEGRSWWRIFIPGQKLRWGSSGLLLVGLVITLLVFAVFFVPDWLVHKPTGLSQLTGNQRVTAEISLAEARNSVRTTLVQALGGAVVLLTLAVGLGQLVVARQGQLVDRFTKTVEQLGANAVDVRLGAIFALQQIAERPEYARPVAEILVAYLKTNAGDQGNDSPKKGSPTVSGVGVDASRVRLRPDLQAALRILVADELWARTMPGRLDLSFIDVRYADLSGVNLVAIILLGAVLDGSDLRGARMSYADLRRVSLKDADLRGADLRNADLTGATVAHARFDKAQLTDALLVETDLIGAVLKGADLTLTDATNANLSGAILDAAHLDKAVLNGAILRDCKLIGTTMLLLRIDSETDFTHVDFSKAVIDDETRTEINELFPFLQLG